MPDSTYHLLSIRRIGLAMFVSLAFTVPAFAQSGNRNQSPSAPGSPRPGDPLRPPSIRERQFKMMEIEREAAQPPTPREEKLALAQISEDYREIQVINNKMLSGAIPAKQLEYSGIVQTLNEIRKRATRLKENLGFPELDLKASAKEKYKPAQNPDELKANLLTLDGAIMRFVESPIFRTPTVIDLKQAAKTREEVEFIIATSQLISKDAERLNRDAARD
jgi:hypothetical protein